MLDRRFRLETDALHERIDIRIRLRNIARLQGQKVLFCLASEFSLDERNDLHELNRLIVADIIESVR